MWTVRWACVRTLAKFPRRAFTIYAVSATYAVLCQNLKCSGLSHLLVLARKDYCNSFLAGLPAVTLAPLNRVMNSAVRLVAGLGVRDHVTPAMRELHWLPVTFRVQYKLCLMVHSSVNCCSTEYITDILVPMSSLQGRATLRSSTSGSFDVPRRTCFCERTFSVAGPAAWNKLPPNLRLITYNYRFKRALKVHFFSIAYRN